MHKLTFQILAVLRAGPADGQEILHRVRDLGEVGGNPSLPTLYRALRGGLREGWIASTTEEAETGPGRPPQTYRVTGAGLEAVEAEARRHRDLAALVLGAEAQGKGGRP